MTPHNMSQPLRSTSPEQYFSRTAGDHDFSPLSLVLWTPHEDGYLTQLDDAPVAPYRLLNFEVLRRPLEFTLAGISTNENAELKRANRRIRELGIEIEVEIFNNRQHRHSQLNYRTSIEFELTYETQLITARFSHCCQ